jgi:cytochrome P450
LSADPSWIPEKQRADLSEAFQAMRRDLIFSDPPLHTAIRAVFGRALAGRINDELRGRMERIANDLLDAVAAQGGMDLIQDFADRFPFLIIADLMGDTARRL